MCACIDSFIFPLLSLADLQQVAQRYIAYKTSKRSQLDLFPLAGQTLTYRLTESKGLTVPCC